MATVPAKIFAFTLSGFATAGCVLSGVGTYPAAAVLAGTGVAAAGANRKVTGDCWGSCRAGAVCNKDSGMCEMPACGGNCRYDEVCEMERCVLKRREAVSRTAVDGGDEPGDEPSRDESSRDE